MADLKKVRRQILDAGWVVTVAPRESFIVRLTEGAELRIETKWNGNKFVRPVIKLADGTWYKSAKNGLNQPWPERYQQTTRPKKRQPIVTW